MFTSNKKPKLEIDRGFVRFLLYHRHGNGLGLVKGRLRWKSKPLCHHAIYIPTLTNGTNSDLKGDITDTRAWIFCKKQLKEGANIPIFARCPCGLSTNKQQIIHGWIMYDIFLRPYHRYFIFFLTNIPLTFHSQNRCICSINKGDKKKGGG